ncbi:hypothetical protein RvY_15159 [Ramazzottius varieornatus]|uniref:Uncharacterized protein n=1 Tax=Ramazzottius varieornatus TaxID=947166 RepID=A0A1D1VTW9_RAMVA|nr:hypothetical protein RvY_15159 [Ramazzottius varieornatus]
MRADVVPMQQAMDKGTSSQPAAQLQIPFPDARSKAGTVPESPEGKDTQFPSNVENPRPTHIADANQPLSDMSQCAAERHTFPDVLRVKKRSLHHRHGTLHQRINQIIRHTVLQNAVARRSSSATNSAKRIFPDSEKPACQVGNCGCAGAKSARPTLSQRE